MDSKGIIDNDYNFEQRIYPHMFSLTVQDKVIEQHSDLRYRRAHPGTFALAGFHVHCVAPEKPTLSSRR